MQKVDSWNAFQHFQRNEFSSPDQMSWTLIQMLDFARGLAGFPFHVNSSFRAGDDGSHGKGLAVDLRCTRSYERFIMIEALIRVGFRRIGVYSRHIHVDIDPDKLSGTMWYGYYSPGKEGHDASEANE